MTTTEPTFAVTIELSLDTVIGQKNYRQYNEDGDYTSEDVTIGERVADLVAERLVTDYRKELRESWGFDADKVAKQAVETVAVDMLEKALEKTVTPTNAFGEPKGAPSTLAEVIQAQVQSWLTTKAEGRDSYGYGGSKTNLQSVMEKAVDVKAKQEMQKAVEEAKAAVVKELTAEAAQTIRKAVADIQRKATGL